jgi:RHS repeat-associated protein
MLLLGLLTSVPWDAAAQSERKIPGMSLGSFKVSNNGAADYSIPIAVPPSFGPTPRLSLSYNSQTGNGTLGVGWSLSGLSAIHRCPQTMAQDNAVGGINFDAKDRFCLDGQRLMVISGAYGADGAEYRTELDTFVRVFSYGNAGGGPAHFIVKNKAGETLEFGNTVDSAIQAIENGNLKAYIRVWALNKITDTSGNYLTITYQEDVADRDYRPLSIDYAGNAGLRIVPQRSVKFNYEPRTDKYPMYMGGAAVKIAERIKTIQTYAPPPGGGASVLAREYRMTYEYGTATSRSRLKTVTECFVTTCLPAHTFTWQEGPNKFIDPAPITTDLNGTDWFLNLVGDFNGDGKMDIVSKNGTGQCSVHLSKGTSFDIQPWACIMGVNGYNYVGDFNGDGKSDIVSWLDDNRVTIQISNGAGFDNYVSNAILNKGSRRFNIVGDFNGDGKADIASLYSGIQVRMHLANSTGTAFDNSLWSGASIEFGFPDQFQFVGDFNGDGLTDIATWGNQSTAMAVNLSTGNGFKFSNWTVWNGAFWLNTIGLNYIGDFNGDGKTDIVAAKGTTVNLLLSTGDKFREILGLASTLNADGKNYVGDFNGDGKSDIVNYNGTNNTVGMKISTGTGFINSSSPGRLGDGFKNVGDFDGDGKTDILRRINATSAHLNLSSGPFPDLITSITNNLGGKIDITYKPLTDTSVYTKDNDAVYPVIDLQVPIYVVDNYVARTQNDTNGQNFKYTYDYGGAKFHLLGRGGLGFRWVRVVDETAQGQTTSYFNQTFPFTGMLNFSETARTQNPLARFAQMSNTYTAIDTHPGLTLPSGEPMVRFPALSRTDKSQCDGLPACLQTADQFTYDVNGNLALAHHLGDVSITGDERDEVTDWIVDATNWIHRPKRNALLDSTGATVREKWLYYDDQLFGILGARALVTKEESRLTGGQGNGGNPTVSYHYDGFGNRDSTTNPTGCATSITFDSTRTFPETVTNCLGHVASFTWDPRFGVKLTETDPNNQATSFTYDTFGRPLTVVGPLDSSSFPSATFAYFDWGNALLQRIETKKRKDHGLAATISRLDYFDGLGRFDLVKSDGPGGNTIEEAVTYDSRGLVVQKFAPRFSTETALPPTASVFDVLGRQTLVTFPDGRTAQTIYEPGKVTLIDERGKEKIKFSDAYGRVIEIQEKDGAQTYSTFYQHDPAGSLVRVTNHLGHHTRVQYDFLGRKIAMCDPNMGAGPNTTICDASTPGVWKYAYDKAGNLLTQTDAKNQAITFVYDALSRVKQKTSTEGTITHTFDDPAVAFSKGRLTKVQDLNSMQTTFLYDKMGRVTQTQRTIDGFTYTMSQTYNALSKVTSETFPDLDSASYTYDAEWLSAIPGYVNSITYNARGQKKTIQYFNNVLTTFNYFDQTTDTLKNFGLKSRVTSGPGGSLQNLSYDYDDTGNVESITDTLFTASRIFNYDDINRLTNASGAFGGANQSQTTCAYSFNAIGNILNKCGVSYSYNDLNHPSFVTNTSDGKTYTADINGNTLTGAGRTFVWTPDNRVASVANASGTTTMRYDYTGARVKKLGPLGQVLYPFAGYEVGPTGTKTKFFRLGNELLAAKQSPTAGNPTRFFYHNDHLGGVNVITDDDPIHNGARQQLTEYDPWGKVSRIEGNVDPEHRFTGQKLDPENGLYYYGARYYDPELARFISPDPIVPSAGDPQSHNRYSYVRNNPVKYIDPDGHSFLSFLFGGIFKAFSFVITYAMSAYRLAGGVLELMGGGGNILQALQSIASSMSSFIKNSQFQFASQIFGFFSSAASPGGATGAGASVGDSTVSEASSVAGGSGGDSGSGEINLGTGSFTYWAKNSAGEYEIHPYPSSQSYYYGETTFTFVREASGTSVADGLTVSLGVKLDVGFLGAGGGGTLLNFGYSKAKGLSFSLTGTWEAMAITGPTAGVQGVFQYTNLLSVRDLNGPFLSLGKAFQPAGLPGFFGGEAISTLGGQLVGYTLFGGAGFRGTPGWPVLTTFTYSSTSSIAGWSSNSGSFFLTDR